MPHELNPNVQFRNLVNDMSEVVDEAILHMLESHHPDDKVLASLAEARGNVVRMNHALKVVVINIVGDQDRTYADELPQGARPKPLPLPKVQKQPKPKNGKDNHYGQTARPGISKLLKSPRDFLCPSCLAEPGTACFVMTGPGHRSEPTEKRRTDSWVHSSRSKLAADANVAIKAKYDKEHFES